MDSYRRSLFYAISYRFYAAFIASKILVLDTRRLTPATRLNDGIDYDPTNKWVLFGIILRQSRAPTLIGPNARRAIRLRTRFLMDTHRSGPRRCGPRHGHAHGLGSQKWEDRSRKSQGRNRPVGGFAASLAIIFIIIVALAVLALRLLTPSKTVPGALSRSG